MDAHSPAAPTPPPHQSESEVDLSRAAVGWCIALVASIAIATISASYDSNRRETLEKSLEYTAVGDHRFYPLSAGDAAPLSFEGAPLLPADKTPSPMPEARMRLAGYTDQTSFRLYVPEERENANGATGGPSWYVKVGAGSFLRMTR